MIVKAFEIRDSMTFIPVVGISLCPKDGKQQYLLARAGFGTTPQEQIRFVVLFKLIGNMQTYDPLVWNDRTMTTAHRHIRDNFEKLESGEVIDVQYILGETKEVKQSERISVGY